MTFTLPSDPDFAKLRRVKVDLDTTYDALNRYLERMNQQLEVHAPRLYAEVPVVHGADHLGTLRWEQLPTRGGAWRLSFVGIGAIEPIDLIDGSLQVRLCAAQAIQALADALIAEATRRTQEFTQELAKLQ